MLSFHPAQQNDLPLLAHWNYQLIRDEGHGNPMNEEQLAERMKEWLQTLYTAIIFSIDGEAIGYYLYRTDEDKIYLRQLFVRRDERRSGVGTKAIKHFIDTMRPLKKRLTVEVLAANEAAVAFWRSAGFKDYSLELEILPSSL